jgi:hypothetical protein
MSATGSANPGFRIDPQTVDSMQVDGEVVVLSLLNHTYFGLNDTASAVWELLKAHPGITAADIAANLAAQHPRAAEAIVSDLPSLLDTLVAQQLVSTGAGGGVTLTTPSPSSRPYTAPRLEKYGALDTLILSGE